MRSTPSRGVNATLTATALVAFAANSLICRVALRDGSIDAASFSAVRLAAGAATLLFLLAIRRTPVGARRPGSWASAAALFLYAVPFSFAYLSLGAATGALLLFGAVQLTMVLAAVRNGQRPRPVQWLGLGAAFGGLVYLFLPGLSAPSPAGAALMLAAGVAWGIYSLRGHRTADALAETAGNFARAVPLALATVLIFFPTLHARPSGVAWAALSGAVASGLGYAIWYRALRMLTSVTAAVVQLAVPLLAGMGGVALLGEQLTLRLAASAVLVLGGIAMTILGRPRTA